MSLFIKKNNLLGFPQFFFQKDFDTSHSILELLDSIYDSLNNELTMGAVFLDFFKSV